MFLAMEKQKPVNPREITLLGIWRIVWNSYRNQILAVKIRMLLPKPVFRILNCLIEHFVASGYRRVVFTKRFGTREPEIPLEIISPGQFKEMAKEKSQRIDFLPELPIGNLGIPAQVAKPDLNGFNGMFTKPYTGVVVNKGLNMASIPGDSSFGNAKKSEYVAVFVPEYFNSGVFGLSSSLHEKSCSLRLICMENIYRTFGGILQYRCQRHITILEPAI